MPCPAEIEALSCAERVDRVPKLTSFSIFAWIRAEETSFKAAAIVGSAMDLFAGACAFVRAVKIKAIAKASTGIRGVIENVGAVFLLSMGDPAGACKGRQAIQFVMVRPNPKSGRT